MMTEEQIAKLEALTKLGTSDVMIASADLAALCQEVRLRGGASQNWKMAKEKIDADHALLQQQVDKLIKQSKGK